MNLKLHKQTFYLAENIYLRKKKTKKNDGSIIKYLTLLKPVSNFFFQKIFFWPFYVHLKVKNEENAFSKTYLDKNQPTNNYNLFFFDNMIY